jgi:hypothetical protein
MAFITDLWRECSRPNGAKAVTILLADPVAVKRLEVLERREVKRHHDEQHLGA